MLCKVSADNHLCSVSISGLSTQGLLHTTRCFRWDLTERTYNKWFAAQGTQATKVGWEFLLLPGPSHLSLWVSRDAPAALSEHSCRWLISPKISLISVSNVSFINFISQFSSALLPLWYLRDTEPHSFSDNSQAVRQQWKRQGYCHVFLNYDISGQWAQIRRHSTFSQTAGGCWHQGFGLGRGYLLLLVKKTDKHCESVSGSHVLITLLIIIVLWGYWSKYPVQGRETHDIEN